MIKNDSTASLEKYREENISNMEYENVKEIYVERCNIPIRYVKELRTGKLIPLRKDIFDNGNIVDKQPVSRPIFVREVISYVDNKMYFEHNNELKLVDDCILNDYELATYIDSLYIVSMCCCSSNDKVYKVGQNIKLYWDIEDVVIFGRDKDERKK